MNLAHNTQLRVSIRALGLNMHEPVSHEKTCFGICENKGAEHLCSKCAADQCLCFRYIDSTIPLLPKSEISVATDGFVSDTVRNHEDRFSHRFCSFHIQTW